ncbi:MAG: hypothetical protein U0670_00535 [Anaerolineae bacterium]
MSDAFDSAGFVSAGLISEGFVSAGFDTVGVDTLGLGDSAAFSPSGALTSVLTAGEFVSAAAVDGCGVPNSGAVLVLGCLAVLLVEAAPSRNGSRWP